MAKKIMWLMVIIILIGFSVSIYAATIVLPEYKSGKTVVENIKTESEKGRYTSSDLPKFLKIDEKKGYVYGKIPVNFTGKIKFSVDHKVGGKETKNKYILAVNPLYPILKTFFEKGKITGYKVNNNKISVQELKTLEKEINLFLIYTAKPLGINPRMVKIPNKMTDIEKAQYLSNLINLEKIKTTYEKSGKDEEAKKKLILSLHQHQTETELLYLQFQNKELQEK